MRLALIERFDQTLPGHFLLLPLPFLGDHERVLVKGGEEAVGEHAFSAFFPLPALFL